MLQWNEIAAREWHCAALGSNSAAMEWNNSAMEWNYTATVWNFPGVFEFFSRDPRGKYTSIFNEPLVKHEFNNYVTWKYTTKKKKKRNSKKYNKPAFNYINIMYIYIYIYSLQFAIKVPCYSFCWLSRKNCEWFFSFFTQFWWNWDYKNSGTIKVSRNQKASGTWMNF